MNRKIVLRLVWNIDTCSNLDSSLTHFLIFSANQLYLHLALLSEKKSLFIFDITDTGLAEN